MAPAIGNKHGVYDGQPELDYKLLEEINKLNIPLVLHGASGISEEDLKKCINLGIAKINFNTDLQIAWANEVRKFIKAGEQALKKVVKEKIDILG